MPVQNHKSNPPMGLFLVFGTFVTAGEAFVNFLVARHPRLRTLMTG